MTGDLPSFLADAGVGAIHGFAGTMLVAAGASKFWSSDDFSPVVAAYDIVPAPLVLPFAAALPIAEMLFGILLILPGVPAVVCGAATMFAAFGLAVALNLLRGRTELECGCGGDATPISWAIAGGNLLLAAALTVSTGIGEASISIATAAGLTCGAATLLLIRIYRAVSRMQPTPRAGVRST